jgi:K+-transporting ATPase A subunit
MPPLTWLFHFMNWFYKYAAPTALSNCVQSVAEKFMPTSLIYCLGIAAPTEPFLIEQPRAFLVKWPNG